MAQIQTLQGGASSQCSCNTAATLRACIDDAFVYTHNTAHAPVQHTCVNGRVRPNMCCAPYVCTRMCRHVREFTCVREWPRPPKRVLCTIRAQAHVQHKCVNAHVCVTGRVRSNVCKHLQARSSPLGPGNYAMGPGNYALQCLGSLVNC